MVKKKIMVFIDWYLPGYKAGGPIKSCVSLVERMSDHFQFLVVTGNTDLNETIPYPGIKPDEWNTVEGTSVFYCSKKFLTRKNIEHLINSEQPDILYLNSMFSLHFTLYPLWISKKQNRYKVIVAPRGMLSPGALALKALKKKVFLRIAKWMGLFNHVTFHASTLIEMQEVRNVFGTGARVLHAINLTPKTVVSDISRKKNTNEVQLVYVGRISEVKNLLQCLQVLKGTDQAMKFRFDIYGPVDDQMYLEQCKAEIATLPSHVEAAMHGPVNNKEIGKVLSGFHFLFLLSMNENYGHAIVEGLTSGLPVIIGNRTPWRNLEEKKCGWDLPLGDNNKIVEVLNYAASMDQSTYNTWSQAASSFAAGIHDNHKAIEDHLQLFNS